MQGDKSITQWFGENLAILLSEKILAVCSTFKAKSYIEAVKDKCTSLSYAKRIELHADELKKELPDSYEQALEILLGILGEENPNETGMFKEYYWIMPIGKFVEKNGLDHVDLSFKAIEEITKRNTGEYAIRPFIRKYPEETIERMREWAKSTNFHLRRLSAEGLRPKLPWASKLDIFIDNPTPVFNILSLMKKEHIRFVQKSIANNLADYLKVNSVPALRLLQNWSKSKNKYTQWMVKYAMRNQKKIITTIITAVLMFCFLPVSKPVLARSVSIPSVQIVATIKPDGTACIEERRTIRFDGSFTEGFYELPKNGYAFLSDFSLSDEEGAYVENFSLNKKQQTYHRTESKDMIRFDFYYQAKDIQKTFTFRYQLHQIVQLYFLWKRTDSKKSAYLLS
jgi:3-methyladenine DNA glycosylase AlkC